MDQNIQFGFLIGVYFLASTGVALVLIYLSHPGMRSSPEVNGIKSEKNNDSLTDNQANSIRKRVLMQFQSLLLRKRAPNKPTKLPKSKEPGSQDPDPAKKSDLKQKQVMFKKSGDPNKGVESKKSIAKELLTSNSAAYNPISLSATQNSPKTVVDSIQEKPDKLDKVATADQPTVNQNISNPIAQPALIINQAGVTVPEQSTQEKFKVEEAIIKQLDPKVKPENTNNPPATSVKVINENGGTITMEQKNQSPKTNDDFSDLFTEDDDQENEVGRLAKELSDINTEDILDETRDLIFQFKKKS